MPKFSGTVQETDKNKNLVVDGLALKIASNRPELQKMLTNQIDVGTYVAGDYYENPYKGRVYNMVTDLEILEQGDEREQDGTQASELSSVSGLFRSVCLSVLTSYLGEAAGDKDPVNSNVQAFLKGSTEISREIVTACTEFTAHVLNREKELEVLFEEPEENDEPPF